MTISAKFPLNWQYNPPIRAKLCNLAASPKANSFGRAISDGCNLAVSPRVDSFGRANSEVCNLAAGSETDSFGCACARERVGVGIRPLERVSRGVVDHVWCAWMKLECGAPSGRPTGVGPSPAPEVALRNTILVVPHAAEWQPTRNISQV